MLRRRNLLGAALTAAAMPAARAAQPADAQPANAQPDEPLRIAWRDAVPDLDPYHNQLRTGFVLAHHLWDCLVDRDPATFQLRPLLAASWRQEDTTTLRFTLRPGVTFHDGSPCDAADVAYTVATVVAGGSAVPALFGWLAGAEQVDALTVRLKLRQPYPAALEYLAMVLPILPRAYRERVGAEGFAVAPIGTGPYRLAPSDGSPDHLRLERFDGYFADSPKGRPAIRRLHISVVATPQDEVAALLGGRADWIWQIGPRAFATVAATPGLQALHGDSMRLGYLSLDAAGRSGAGNPLTDVRVRQAICRAIDRDALAQRLGVAVARVAVAPCYPTQFGCDAGAVVRYAYDPAQARTLLAAAGFADGFTTDLVSYVLPEIGQAVRDALGAVGIAARLVQLPTAEAMARAEAGHAPMFLGTWGSYSINDVTAILPQFFGGGPLDYADLPDLQALIARAGHTGDTDMRRGLYAQAIHMITEQALWLPLHIYAATYGLTRRLDFRPPSDELPRFYLAKWKPAEKSVK